MLLSMGELLCTPPPDGDGGVGFRGRGPYSDGIVCCVVMGGSYIVVGWSVVLLRVGE